MKKRRCYPKLCMNTIVFFVFLIPLTIANEDFPNVKDILPRIYQE